MAASLEQPQASCNRGLRPPIKGNGGRRHRSLGTEGRQPFGRVLGSGVSDFFMLPNSIACLMLPCSDTLLRNGSIARPRYQSTNERYVRCTHHPQQLSHFIIIKIRLSSMRLWTSFPSRWKFLRNSQEATSHCAASTPTTHHATFAHSFTGLLMPAMKDLWHPACKIIPLPLRLSHFVHEQTHHTHPTGLTLVSPTRWPALSPQTRQTRSCASNCTPPSMFMLHLP